MGGTSGRWMHRGCRQSWRLGERGEGEGERESDGRFRAAWS